MNRMRQYLFAVTLLIPALAAGQTASPAAARKADGEISKAVEAARLRPTDAAWTNLGDAYMQKARETADLSYYGRADGAYRKALALNPRFAGALAGMAWVSGGRHEFEQSIEWANKALAVEPRRADAYGMLGDASVEMGDYETAFEQYQKMLDIHPDISSYSRGAHLLFLTGDTKKATLLMLKAIEAGAPFAENTAWCKAQLALMQFAQGSYLSASQLLTEALKATPDNYHLLAAMGKVKGAMKDYPAAIDYYEKAQAIVPQHDVVVALGDLYTLLGKQDKAEAKYALVEAIRKLDKANGVAGDIQTAQFLADHGKNPAEALRIAEAEYKTRPNVYVADTLAWSYYRNGRIAEAKKYIDKALRQRTPEAMFLYHKGMIYAKAGEMAAARTALYQALSDNPDFHPLAAPEAVKAVRELGSQAAR